MTFYDEKLKQLQEQTARKRRLEVLLEDLREQEKELSMKAFELHESKIDEEDDVKRLEGRSLAAFFYNVIGKMDEKLDKEREEAYAAAVKYDMAAQEWEQVKEDIRKYEEEFRGLTGCEKAYEEALTEKIQKVKAEDKAEAQEVINKEEHLAYLESQKKEIQEAITAGRSALSVMKNIMSSLNSAGSYGTWDIIGGGLLADIGKYNHLDEAQNQIERLQLALRGFKTELADVKLDADIQINIDGFMRFADYAFDNIFTDWAVMDKINQAQAQVQRKQQYVEEIIEKLQGMLENLDMQKEKTKAELSERLIQIPAK